MSSPSSSPVPPPNTFIPFLPPSSVFSVLYELGLPPSTLPPQSLSFILMEMENRFRSLLRSANRLRHHFHHPTLTTAHLNEALRAKNVDTIFPAVESQLESIAMAMESSAVNGQSNVNPTGILSVPLPSPFPSDEKVFIPTGPILLTKDLQISLEEANRISRPYSILHSSSPPSASSTVSFLAHSLASSSSLLSLYIPSRDPSFIVEWLSIDGLQPINTMEEKSLYNVKGTEKQSTAIQKIQHELAKILKINPHGEANGNAMVIDSNNNSNNIANDNNTQQDVVMMNGNVNSSSSPLDSSSSSSSPSSSSPSPSSSSPSSSSQLLSSVSSVLSKVPTSILPAFTVLLSDSHQLYFHHLTSSIISHDSSARAVGLQTLRREEHLHPILPFLSQWISVGVTQKSKDLFSLRCYLDAIESILLSPSNRLQLSISPFLHQLIPCVLFCLVSSTLGSSDYEDHWQLRDDTSVLLHDIVGKYHSIYPNLTLKIIKSLQSALSDEKKSIGSKYGALRGFIALGGNAIEKHILPVIPSMIQYVYPAIQHFAKGKSINDNHKEVPPLSIIEMSHIHSALVDCAAHWILYSDNEGKTWGDAIQHAKWKETEESGSVGKEKGEKKEKEEQNHQNKKGDTKKGKGKISSVPSPSFSFPSSSSSSSSSSLPPPLLFDPSSPLPTVSLLIEWMGPSLLPKIQRMLKEREREKEKKSSLLLPSSSSSSSSSRSHFHKLNGSSSSQQNGNVSKGSGSGNFESLFL